MKNGIDIIIDGQWGSTGKGKVAGYMVSKIQYDAAVCNFMTNAGHTYVWDDDTDFLFQHIPVSAVNPNIQLYLASTSAFHVNLLFDELNKLSGILGTDVSKRLHIDRHALIIEERHAEMEKMETVKIASTMKGCGMALSEKIRRINVKLAKDIRELEPYICDVKSEINDILEDGGNVIGETAQGFGLSLNHGYKFPYVTSRDITPMSFLNDICVHPVWLRDIIGVIRTFPIRVGNVYENAEIKGFSGYCYPDQEELSWDIVSNLANKKIFELTSVTKRVRRVFTFSKQQYYEFMRYCRPDILFVNFINYFNTINSNSDLLEIKSNPQFGRFMTSLEEIHDMLGRRPRKILLGTGAKNSETIELI